MNKNSIIEKLSLSQSDIKQIEESTISWESLAAQLHYFNDGTESIVLERPCTINDGIAKINEKEEIALIQKFEDEISQKKMSKFVPASGAATRMFKDLIYVTKKHQKINRNLLNENKKQHEYKSVLKTIDNFKNFGFYNELKNRMLDDGLKPEDHLSEGEYSIVLDYLLNEKGLNYSSSPKGFIKFHSYIDDFRTAFEEHIVESKNYVSNSQKISNLHFTLSDENYLEVERFIERALPKYEADGSKIIITYSTQKKSTDTIAFNSDGSIARDENGKILLRPAGHGALLENLNDIDADVIFIKNIDNVLPDRTNSQTFMYKKLLAGILADVQSKIFSFLQLIDSKRIDDEILLDLKGYLKGSLNIDLPENFDTKSFDDQIAYCYSKLNRPIRVCGMVKNEGEPGGGPFWVRESDGTLSKQIVEAAQIDLTVDKQKEIFNSSTHFNPVDIVCGMKDYKGEKFNLLNFRNPDLGIVSTKSQNGYKIKVLELPGLWNGGMHNWITIFVEVPLSTFNPVKELNDLLKPAHQ